MTKKFSLKDMHRISVLKTKNFPKIEAYIIFLLLKIIYALFFSNIALKLKVNVIIKETHRRG